jgi:hypothetical protein
MTQRAGRVIELGSFGCDTINRRCALAGGVMLAGAPWVICTKITDAKFFPKLLDRSSD